MEEGLAMERISNYQLAVTIILFEIGSTPLFALGSGAKQDSWLAMLLAAAAGLLLLFMFLYIQRIAPEECLIGLLKTVFRDQNRNCDRGMLCPIFCL